MIDVKTQLVSALKTSSGYEVYYELFTQPATIPCITYREIDNIDTLTGDTIEYSEIRFEVRIYANSPSIIGTKASAIDAALKQLGYRRYYSYEDNDGRRIIKINRYVATGYKEV